MDRPDLRAVVFQVIEERSRQHPTLHSETIIRHAQTKLGINKIEDEQALLAFFYDLFRIGYLSWGHNVSNPSPPLFHVTDVGRKALAQHSRDPANPDGYLSHLRATAGIGPITESYISEGLLTFNTGCFKATAVMAGAAAESLVLDVRDTLVVRLTLVKAPVPKGFERLACKTNS